MWLIALSLRFSVFSAIWQQGFEDSQQRSSGIKVHLHIRASKCKQAHSCMHIQKLLGETRLTLVFISPLFSCLCCCQPAPRLLWFRIPTGDCQTPRALTACTICRLLQQGGAGWIIFFSAPVLRVSLLRDTEKFIPFVQVMQKQLNVIHYWGWNPQFSFTASGICDLALSP